MDRGEDPHPPAAVLILVGCAGAALLTIALVRFGVLTLAACLLTKCIGSSS